MRTRTLALPDADRAWPARRLPMPILIAVFCLLWGSTFSVAKIAVGDCPPLLLLTVRFLLAGAVIFAARALYGVPLNLSRRDVAVFSLLGLANQGVYLGLNFVGLRSISSGLSALIISANPVLTAMLAVLFLDDRMNGRKALGLALGIGGVAFVVDGRLAGGLEDPVGIGFTVAALVSFIGGTILFKKLAPTGGLWVGNGVQSLAAGLATLPFAFAFESTSDIVPSWRLMAALVYLTLFVSIFAYLLWFHLINVAGATGASSYHFLMPPLGMLFGWLLLGEHVALADLLGIVPVAIGIYLVTHPSRSRERGTHDKRVAHLPSSNDERWRP
jgi:drug/metabolite transporter (DMT)-like permease